MGKVPLYPCPKDKTFPNFQPTFRPFQLTFGPFGPFGYLSAPERGGEGLHFAKFWLTMCLAPRNTWAGLTCWKMKTMAIIIWNRIFLFKKRITTMKPHHDDVKHKRTWNIPEGHSLLIFTLSPFSEPGTSTPLSCTRGRPRAASSRRAPEDRWTRSGTGNASEGTRRWPPAAGPAGHPETHFLWGEKKVKTQMRIGRCRGPFLCKYRWIIHPKEKEKRTNDGNGDGLQAIHYDRNQKAFWAKGLCLKALSWRGRPWFCCCKFHLEGWLTMFSIEKVIQPAGLMSVGLEPGKKLLFKNPFCALNQNKYPKYTHTQVKRKSQKNK